MVLQKLPNFHKQCVWDVFTILWVIILGTCLFSLKSVQIQCLLHLSSSTIVTKECLLQSLRNEARNGITYDWSPDGGQEGSGGTRRRYACPEKRVYRGQKVSMKTGKLKVEVKAGFCGLRDVCAQFRSHYGDIYSASLMAYCLAIMPGSADDRNPDRITIFRKRWLFLVNSQRLRFNDAMRWPFSNRQRLSQNNPRTWPTSTVRFPEKPVITSVIWLFAFPVGVKYYACAVHDSRLYCLRAGDVTVEPTRHGENRTLSVVSNFQAKGCALSVIRRRRSRRSGHSFIEILMVAPRSRPEPSSLRHDYVESDSFRTREDVGRPRTAMTCGTSMVQKALAA